MAKSRPERSRLAGAARLLLAACAAAWALTVLPLAVLEYEVDRASRASAATLAGGDARLQSFQRRLAGARWKCLGSLNSDRLLLAAARLELALGRDDVAAQDARVDELRAAARTAIGCAPQDGSAWLDLYWLQVRSDGLSERAVDFLRNSHRFAPHEAGVALVRSRLELPVLDHLPPDLRTAATEDLAELVEARLEEPAADALQKLGPASRDMLVAAVERKVDGDARNAFEAALRRRKLVPEREDVDPGHFHMPFVQAAP